ncbi:calcium-binding protein [Pseudomonas chlororaphis]|uniref:calcium-binding protein n=1 Tax=Pseudomonas chlororaphis TaxID=587753 RepID=UPI0023659756|nr:calcium-binding protein [Pseudomonas chlororaphis]WDG52371.1 calcium-binding protein [Pseudomonas chlororaphis]WDH86612.1 calcium-binding protein [Pseudomonas chlororaphis]
MYFGADYPFNVQYDTPISLDQNAVDQGFSFMGDIFDQGTSEAGAAWSSLIEHINNMSTLEKGSAVFGAMQFAFTKVLANTPLGAPAAIGAFAGKVSVLSEAISEGNVKPSDVINVASGILGLISSFAALATLGIAGTAAAVGATTVATTFGGAAIIVAGIGFLLDRYGDELAGYVGDGWNSFKDFMSGALGDIADALSSIGDAVSQGFDDLISQLSDLFDQARNTVSPLILDLDGDGVETLGINAGVHFDHDGNGFAETTGWVSKDDGLLVWDRNGNGRIDDGSELFGNYSTLANGQNAANGFAALADLDSNHDGKIDASDAAFNQLYVWRDSNSDATVAAGELLSLTEANVGSLNIAFTSQNQTDAQGNQVLQTGTYTDANGVTHSMNDIWFSVDTARTQDLSQIAISAEIAALPDMAGFGNVADLSQVMARDENGHLQTLVEQFASETDATVRQALLEQIVFVWSGAAGYSATSRGGYIDDGRKLYAVEAFLGQTFLQSAGTNAGTPNPGPNAAAQLMQAYDQLANFVYAGLMLQTHFKPLIESLDLSLAGNAIELDVTALVEQLRTLYNQDAELGTQTMAEFGRCLTDIGSTRGTEILASLRQAGDVNAAGFSLVLASIGYTLGGSENDELYGDGGVNLLLGLSGRDTIYGDAGNDTLDGGAGNDYLSGDAGSDIYRFSRGWGQDTLNNFDSGIEKTDAIEFASNIASTDIAVTRSGDNLILSLKDATDKITVSNYFNNDGTSPYKLDDIRFSDGTTWGIDQVKVMVMVSTAGADELHGYATDDQLSGGLGNDSLYGADGDDELGGAAGNDRLEGGAGSDLYIFNLGDGQDVISENASNSADIDVLRFGEGISPADISVGGIGASLVLSHSNGQDQVTILNWFYQAGTRYQLEKIEFTDGTVWTGAQLTTSLLQQSGTEGDDVITGVSTSLSQVVNGGGGNDTLTAGSGNDQLEGGTGNDVLNGGIGSDVYLFNLGDGQDVINDDAAYYGGNFDVLRFGAGIEVADITTSVSGMNLVLSHGNGQDKVTIKNWFAENTGRYQLERIEFADGTVWTSAALSAPLLQLTGGAGDDVLTGISSNQAQIIRGGGGNDTLTAGRGADRLEGGTGNDVLNGGRGSDLYLFNLGDGQDVINDDNSIYSDVDVLRFGAGILAADITASRSGINLVLSHVNGQDKITLTNWFAENTGRYQLERIEFADGTVWTSMALSAQLLQFTGGAGDDVLTGVSVAFNQVFSGGGGNDTLTAGSGADRLEGGTGNDVLNGGRGSDLYLFNLGDGQDVINDDNSIYSGVDVLRFGAGILAADITASRFGINLVLSHANGQDKITLTNWFAENTGRYQLERIEFADGTVWTSAALSAPLLQLTGGAGDDVLTGISSNQAQIIRGGGGNDTLTAGTGDDLFEGGTGNDVLNGGRGSDLYLFNLGDGQDVINDDNSIYSDVDVLRFGAGILAADITASRSGINLVLSHANGQDKITLTNWFAENTGRYQLERIEFADGTVWTSMALSAQLLQFTGGAGDDVLTGVSVAFNQVFSGGGGNDTLTAGSGDDRLEGGTGNDALNGGRGSDLYLFNLGDGQDVINDDNSIYSGVDVLRFGAGILAADITASRSGINLVLSHANGQDKITLTNWFAENTGRYQLERIEFADGTVWTSAALSAPLLQLTGGAGDDVLTGISSNQAQIIRGGGGNDTLTAGTGDDLFEGGTGNDVLNGGRGSDLYLFNLGDGQDVINDDNSIYSDVDVLRFGAGILAADITASRSGINLVLSHVNGQDKITLTNWFAENTGRYQLERIEFADGTVWTSTALSAQLLQFTGGAGDDVLTGVSVAFNQVFSGGGGNDTLTAGSGADRLEGGTGNDVLNGGRGSDLYLFNLGDGQDVINDDNSIYSGVDVLRFGAGILAADITASRSGINLVLSHANGQDKITLTNWFAENTGRYQLERIEFADGTVWTSTALSAQLLQFTGGAGDDVLTGVSVAFNQVFSGGGGNDTLTAGSGADRLEGGTGNDVLNGGRGSDLYLFNLGDGQDVINDDNSIYSGVDVLRFGAGILAADITASRSGINLILSHVNGQDKITLTNWFAESTGRYQLERIEFADGVIWSSSQVTSRTSTAGNDVIVGTSNNDRLQGGKGNDSLQGGDGSDTYVFIVGDGLDTINNLSSTPGDTDVLSIEGISNQNLWFSHENNNLVIDVTGSEDRITIQDWYNNTAQQIDVIQAGSTALYANAVDNLVNAMAAFGPPAGGEISLTQAQRDQVNVVIAANWQ